MSKNLTHINRPSDAFLQALLQKKTPLEMVFVSSGLLPGTLPVSDLYEIAVVGKSNVGKSSLLNFISGQKHLAHVSHSPGRTRTINLFSAEKGAFMLADLPGYGYAKISKEQRDTWEESMQAYFEDRKGLRGVLFLVDIRREITEEERHLSKWFQNMGLRVIGVQTKCDKVHKSQWVKLREQQAHDLLLVAEQMVSTSSDKKIGLAELLHLMAGLLFTEQNDNTDVRYDPFLRK